MHLGYMAGGTVGRWVRWEIYIIVREVLRVISFFSLDLKQFTDSVFFMHQANLDRVWQNKNLEARLVDISRPINILDYSNALGGNVTLDFPISVVVNAKIVTIRVSCVIRMTYFSVP